MVAMESLDQLDPIREWRFEDLGMLPDELRRFVEIIDGLLVVSPSPGNRHNTVIDDLHELLLAAAPRKWRPSVSGRGVRFAKSYLVPDLVVIPRDSVELLARGYLDPAEVLLAVEVVSPSSPTRDRVLKKAMYASVGIPSFWRLEIQPASLTAYRLQREDYVEIGTWPAGEVARLTDPFPVEIEVGRLAAIG